MNAVTVGYAVGYAVNILVTIAFTARILRSDMRARRRFAILFSVLTVWTAISLVSLFVPNRTGQFALKIAWSIGALSTVLSWLRFTFKYARSDYARPIERGFGVAYVVLVISAITDPLHHAYWTSLTYHATPFPHLTSTTGPLFAAAIAYAPIGISVGTYPLIRLFARSRHQTSRALVVLIGGVLVGSVPVMLSVLNIGPFPTRAANGLSVGVFAIAAGYAVFRYEFVDLAPVARDVAVDQLEDPFLAVDADHHRIIDYNPAAAPLLDTADTGIGDPLADAFPELAPDAADGPDAPNEAGTPIVTRTLDGEEYHYTAAISPIREHDTTEGYAVVLSDVTQREVARRRLEAQNERLAEFADVVSHDLRSPLSIAAGRVDLAREESDVAHLDDAADALARMDEIIDGMRERAKRGDVGERERVELAAVATDAWRMVDGPDADLDLKADGMVTAVPDRLQQLFENLFRNAVEHGGSDVTVTVDTTDAGFFVADDGSGLPPGVGDELFERGYTTDEDGTGHGLSIVADVAESHGWRVNVSEAVKGGLRVDVRGVDVRRADA